jgi:hypothetical protein
MAILLIGCVARLSLTLSTDFPLHDGGLFYVMIENIRASHYVLPHFTAFNGLEIPFAYPPLAFYAAAFITDATGLSALDVLRVLPSAVAGGVLLAFFAFAHTMLSSRLSVVAAVFVFAALPSSFSYLIVGAGLAKSFGLLFALLALTAAYRLYTRPRPALTALAAVLGALTVLSHIEMGWFLAFSIAALFVAYGRTREGVRSSVLVATGVVALTAPWWALVLSRHGVAPFLAASQVGSPLTSAMSSESGWLVLAVGLPLLAAFVTMLARPDRRLALLGWLGLVVVLDTRNVAWLPTIPLALGAGAIVGEGLLSHVLHRARRSSGGDAMGTRRIPSWLGLVANALFLNVIFIPLIAMGVANSPLRNFGNVDLGPHDRAAMLWASQETPESSRFLLITGLPQWSADSISEWFPALSGRVSVATPQGSEWLPDREFARRLETHATAQACATANGACLDRWSHESEIAFSHVYVAQARKSCCSELAAALRSDPNYTQIYDGPAAWIFARG